MDIPPHCIYADDRERVSGIPEILREQFHVDVHESRLPWGDYWLGSGIAIERKTVDDFALSIIDGRLFRQIQRMKQRTESVALILEGNPTQPLSVDLHPHAFKGGLLSVALDWDVPIVFSENAPDTALLLWLMQEKHGPLRNEVSIRPGRRPKRLRNRQLYILQGLPSVGPKAALRLLDHFGSVERVMGAAPEQLIKIPGIGRKTAEKIREVVSSSPHISVRLNRMEPNEQPFASMVAHEQGDVEQAARLLDVDAKFFQPFDVNDPFNGDMRLEGFLCQKPNHTYGALALLRVNGRPAPQRIFATPKLHYPFGKDGRFHFPAIHTAHLYEKLDGTNVLAYRYQDADGRRRLTYKLRLSPVLRNSKWGPFLDYWRELLARHPDLPGMVETNGCHISFEMYGARNAHLIAYENDLAVAALFGVRIADATVVGPFQLQTGSVPVAPLLGELRAAEDPVARFQSLREEMNRRNLPAADDKLSGTEGAVWYVTEPAGRVTMWKCKPESVEEIHWATGINKKAVIATCWNALETVDVLNYDALLPLLLEEYSPDDIEKFRANIDDALRQVNEEQEFRQKVRAAYETLKTQGLSITRDKAAVMRALSTQFARAEMGHVYAALVQLGE